MDDGVYHRELRRAQTKTDIFRVLRMACDLFSIEGFVLLDFDAALKKGLAESIVFDNFSQARLDRFLSEPGALAKIDTLASMRFSHWSSEDGETSPLDNLGAPNAVSLMMATKNGSPLLLILVNCKSYASGLDFTSQMLEFQGILARFLELTVSTAASVSLTEREIEIARWTARGKTSAEIAVILGLSQHAVNDHITEAMKKTDAVNRVQFVAKSIRLGYI